MTTILLIILFALWLPVFLHHTLFWVYLIQLKEYRWDRLRAHFDNKEARRIFTDRFAVFKLINTLLLLIFGYLGLYSLRAGLLLAPPFRHVYLVTLFILIALTYLILTEENLAIVKEIKDKKILRPDFTAKAIIIFIFALMPFLVLPAIYWGYGGWSQLILSTILISTLLVLSPFIVLLIAFLVNIPFYFVKKIIIKKAAEKIRQFSDLKVIGVTGSYGKSTTKEFLTALLSQKYQVLKTPQNVNTAIGIAQLILKQLNKNHQVFVVEMGAYKKGEIKEICDLVKPQTGVLTGINEQHLALFKTQENIIKGKFELIESLPPDGSAVLNGDNELIQQHKDKIRIEHIFCSIKNKGDFCAEQIETGERSVQFLADDVQYKMNVLGEFNVLNALMAIAAAKKLGLTADEIAIGLAGVKTPKGTMQIYDGLNNSVIIDDSYNANLLGAQSAVEHLKKFTGKKKIVVFSSLYELGQQAREAHEQLGVKIAEVADVLLLTKDNFTSEIFKNINKGKTKVIIETDAMKAAGVLKDKLTEKSVVLLEGRMADVILASLTEV